MDSSGIDYTFRDILTASERWHVDGFVLKALLKLSKRPSDAFGVGLGYRPPKVEYFGIPVDTIQVFGAWVWTRQDDLDAAGMPLENEHYHGQARIGLSFNVDKVSDWLKL